MTGGTDAPPRHKLGDNPAVNGTVGCSVIVHSTAFRHTIGVVSIFSADP